MYHDLSRKIWKLEIPSLLYDFIILKFRYFDSIQFSKISLFLYDFVILKKPSNYSLLRSDQANFTVYNLAVGGELGAGARYHEMQPVKTFGDIGL